MVSRKQRKYWQGRFEQIEQAANNQSVQYYFELEIKYRRAMREIDNKINAWYRRFAINNNINMTEAKRLLNSKELEEFKWTVFDYIEYGRKNAIDPKWMKQLENASAKFHINRLEALLLDCQQTIEKMQGNQVDEIDHLLRSVYKDTYYRSCFEIQKGFNVGFDVGKLNNARVATIITKPWAVDGLNFKTRCSVSKTVLINSLDKELSTMVLTGESPAKTIARLEKTIKAGLHNTTRLVLTEQAYFSSIAQKACYMDLNVEEYEILATLDGKTCPTCGDMDGIHKPIKELEAGITAPPFHPFCRCTTCPYFNDNFDIGKRAARGEDGKTYYVPVDMTYTEWKSTYLKEKS